MNVLREYPTLRTLSLGTRAHLSRSMVGWWTPPSRRGGRRVVPGVAGEAPRPVVSGPIRFLHPVWVDGSYAVSGAVNGDPAEGWRTNLGLLEAACATVSSYPWTFAAVHTLPGGGTRTAQIQVLDIVVPARLAGIGATVTLDIVVPSGVFTYAAPSP